MRLLNLGCGGRFHPDWENLDYSPVAPIVRRHDLRQGVPYPDQAFEVVYHSHVLEHLPKRDGSVFLRECLRVLKPGGAIRVVVPDLERIAQLYLEALRQSLVGNREWQPRYDWAVIEMYDQAVREASGGEMASFVQNAPDSLKPFLRERIGQEVEGILRMPAISRTCPAEASISDRVRRRLLRFLIGPEGISAYDRGKFRQSGEVHQWMYDRWSLARLLESVGFNSSRNVGPSESIIPGWAAFNLDTEQDGSVYKPDSLFMEATRT